MYAALDEKYNIIAYHDAKRAVVCYINAVMRCSQDDINLTLCKIKKNAEHKLDDKEDLYLVRYGKTFIQSGYLLYMDLASGGLLEENKLVIDILMKRLELMDLSKKEKKTLKNAVEILEQMKYEDERYTPTLQQLQQMKWNYDPYIYNKDIMFDDPYVHY